MCHSRQQQISRSDIQKKEMKADFPRVVLQLHAEAFHVVGMCKQSGHVQTEPRSAGPSLDARILLHPVRHIQAKHL